jgi:DNA-binding MarR family transcriptional regulator
MFFVAYATVKMDGNTLDINKSIIFLTNRLGRLLAIEARKRTDIESYGLMPHHMGILADLWRKDGVRQRDLVISIIKDKATIARALAYLERSNILVRVTDPEDKRNKRIYLTHKGKALESQLLPQAMAIQEEISSQIDRKEFNTCMKVLRQIHDLLTN